VQARFTDGSVEIRVRRLEDDEIYRSIRRTVQFHCCRRRDYRVDTDPSRNATMVTVGPVKLEVSLNGEDRYHSISRLSRLLAEGSDPDIRENPERRSNRFSTVSQPTAICMTIGFLPRFTFSGNPWLDMRIWTNTALERNAGLWLGLDTACRRGMGSVSLWPLGRGLSPGVGRGSTKPLGGLRRFHYGRWAYSRNNWVGIPVR